MINILFAKHPQTTYKTLNNSYINLIKVNNS